MQYGRSGSTATGKYRNTVEKMSRWETTNHSDTSALFIKHCTWGDDSVSKDAYGKHLQATRGQQRERRTWTDTLVIESDYEQVVHYWAPKLPSGVCQGSAQRWTQRATVYTLLVLHGALNQVLDHIGTHFWLGVSSAAQQWHPFGKRQPMQYNSKCLVVHRITVTFRPRFTTFANH